MAEFKIDDATIRLSYRGNDTTMVRVIEDFGGDYTEFIATDAQLITLANGIIAYTRSERTKHT